MTKRSKVWFLYRTAPFRPLYQGGLGFRIPPEKLFLPSLSKKERARWNLWLFEDKTLVIAFSKSFHASSKQRTHFSELSYFPQLSRNLSGSLLDLA